MNTKAKKKVEAVEEVAEVPMITVNGKSYPIDNLPGDIKELIGLYQQWEGELLNAKREAFKIEAALKGITVEMELRLQKYEESLATAAEATG